ncbi:hypothetical protein [Planococcus donghaensis]|uniref:Uncharacterized protein n=1 Tax=Planococcus donghaensis TaxID=414778 RepID=A0A1C7EHR3_9BACL|nr:hypothetical protein [Planococcus donghaensis]ANU23504.1 hypothetical protein BCM40_09015 [Planococcus donghaensis]
MNERIMEFLWRSEVAKLPEEKKRLYRFIVEQEDMLAEKAVTVEDFYSLLIKQSPVDLAVAQFRLPYNRIVKLMLEIEVELEQKISKRYKTVKWIDFTNHSIESTNSGENKLLFLFVN